jgi:uncharacterized repeat protein (TIGR03803 family)
MKTIGTTQLFQGHSLLRRLSITALLEMTSAGIGIAQSIELGTAADAGDESQESPTFRVLYSFKGGTDGFLPVGVIVDSAGNLYGTTGFGGASGNGVVVRLDTAGNEAVLHAFTGAADGGAPDSLVRDAAGNLYGTAAIGGGCRDQGCGTVFRIRP